MADKIRIEGLRETARSLKQVEDGLQKELRQILKKGSEMVAGRGRAAWPRRTGRMGSKIKARATQREASIVLNHPGAGAVDFGGYPGRRDFVPEGRYLYPEFKAAKPELERQLEGEINSLIRRAGLD